jgi:hypothetical protein
VTLPRSLRNRLADVILAALHDPEARRGLQAVAAVCADPQAAACIADLPQGPLRDCFEERDGGLYLKNEWKEHAEDLRERACCAWRAIGGRPLDIPDAPLEAALSAAAALFDAGLYYEVHEWLEPYWLGAEGGDREALQGLIQVAVAFEHLASGNVSGARSLLSEGCAKMLGQQLQGLDLDPFARAAGACLDGIIAREASAGSQVRAPASGKFNRAVAPRFPAAPDPGARSGESANP